MSDLPLVGDLQASAPPVGLALSRAGVTGVHKAIRIRRGAQEILMAAELECTVDLARDQKGVHMSRFPELFDEAIDDVVLGEGLLVEVLADRIATQIVERQQALRAEVRIVARWPLRRRTPVTDLATQEMVSLIGIAAATSAGARRVVGVEATGINACPCAQGLVRGRAAERLAEAGFGDDVERILDLVPLATHNQRGRGTLLVGTARELDAEDLVGIVERSMSAPVYELLKRPDELFVVEHAHLRPRFVEDSVRVALSELLASQPDLDDDDFVLSRQVNLETIHDHDVVAERWGTVGELRGELSDGTAAPRQTTLESWLSARRAPDNGRDGQPARGAVRENRGSVPASSRRTLCRCRKMTPSAASARETDDRPGAPEREREDRERDGGQHRGERRVARDREHEQPDAETRRGGERRERKATPPAVATIFPPLPNARNTGRA